MRKDDDDEHGVAPKVEDEVKLTAATEKRRVRYLVEGLRRRVRYLTEGMQMHNESRLTD
jgi:hypothetical protein